MLYLAFADCRVDYLDSDGCSRAILVYFGGERSVSIGGFDTVYPVGAYRERVGGSVDVGEIVGDGDIVGYLGVAGVYGVGGGEGRRELAGGEGGRGA